jgi:hypothetical protein
MKTFYLDPLNDQVNRATVMLDRIEKSAEDVSGNYAYLPLITARNPGIGSRVDTNGTGPALPPAGSGSYTAASFRMAYHYGRGSVSGPVMRASKDNSGAFAKALDLEMKNLSKSLPESLNRQLWSYGNGRAATLNATQTTSTTLTVSATDIFHAKVGDRVHVADITAGTGWAPATGTTITAISLDSATGVHTLTLAAATGRTVTVGADALYFGGGETLTAAGSSWGQEMYGIPAAVDDGAVGADDSDPAEAGEFITNSLNFGGIDRSTTTIWQAQVLQNPAGAGTNRPLTVSLMEQGFLTSVVRGGADEKDIEIYSNPGIWATFGLLHIGDRIFNDFKQTIAGGWIALMFNNRPFFYDRDCPRDIIWFLDMSTLVFLTQSGYELMDKDGNVLRNISGFDAFEFTLYRDVQLGCRNCSRNTKLDDIDSVYNLEATV